MSYESLGHFNAEVSKEDIFKLIIGHGGLRVIAVIIKLEE
jgi:hypothetical protein